MKSASHSTISSPVYQGDGTLVILARVFHGGEIFVISSRVSQGERWLEDIAKCQRFPSSSCLPITYVFRRMRTSHFLAFFPAFEHYLGERLINEKAGWRKDTNCIFALYNSASVRKYNVEISVWIKLLPGSHSVIYHCYLGSGVPVGKIFSWGPVQ